MQGLLHILTDPRTAWIRLSLSLAVALLCLGLAAQAWVQARTWPERAVLPLQDPLANLNQVGVNVDLAPYTPAELEEVLDRISEGGFVWVRQRFPWEQIEPYRGAYDWEVWDRIVEACERRGLQLIAVLDGAPSWARPEGATSPLTPPREVSAWGDLAESVASRYRGRIAAYQLWDEPNLGGHWGGGYVDPAAYVTLLREGAIRIRDDDPGAAILLAALAPTVEEGPLNLNEAAFLRQVVEAGGRPFFDVVALQPYGFADPPQAEPDASALNYQRAAIVRREMVRLGLGECPVWATAWGWNALPTEREGLPADWDGQPSLWPVVDAERQAAYTVEAVELARREWPWMGPMIVYTYQPDLPANDPRWGFALVDAQGDSSLLFERLAQFNAPDQPLPTGVYVPRADNARYVGQWRFSEAGADPPHGADASEGNASIAFDIAGTALDVTVRRGDYWGLLYVEVDGRPANGLPRDEEGRSYLVLYDPAGQVERVNVLRSPPRRGKGAETLHHVEMVVHGGWGQWPLVDWVVRQEQVQPSGWDALWLLLAGAGAAMFALFQVITTPSLHVPLYAAVGRVYRWYRGLPEPIPVLATLGLAAAFYLAPWTPLALPLLALWAILAFLRIDLGLATVALSLPFYGQPKVLLGRPFSVVELSLWGCAGVWLVARLLDWGRQAPTKRGLDDGHPLAWRLPGWSASLLAWPVRTWRSWTALDKGMIALVLVALLSVNGFAPRHVALHELRTVFLEGALFYALIRASVHSPRARRRLAEGWLLGATIIAGIALGQAIAGRNLITAEGVWRVRGLYGSPNNLALYLERALPLLLAVAWRGPSLDRGDKTWRAVYGAAGLLVLAALLLTFSKGALLVGVPASLLALGLLQRYRRATWIALGALAVLGLVLVPLASTERFRSLLDPTRGTGFIRLKLWRSTAHMIADHPVSGVGLDGFLYAYRSRYVLPSAWEEPNLSHPHNLLLDAWTRLGLAGVAVVAWLLVSFYRTAWPSFRTAAGYWRALLLGAMAAMVAVLAHGMVDHSLFTIDLAFVCVLLLAMVQV